MINLNNIKLRLKLINPTNQEEQKKVRLIKNP